jgi:hypothetical protein
MFKYFLILLAFIIINIVLVVVTITSPFIMIYGIFRLFVKKPEKQKSSFLNTLLREYGNYARTNKPS